MKTPFRKITPIDHKHVTKMMFQLYEEDGQYELEKTISNENIKKTLETLEKHPEKGCVLVLENDQQIIGYSIIINFWSNEYGGNIVDIDELYVQKDFRSQGIGTQFIQDLISMRFNDCVALQLEVNPKNKKARKLYEKLGFETHKNETMTKELN